MNTVQHHRGPWSHRVLIVFFAVALGILFLWLLSFLVGDIGRIEGPDQSKFFEGRLDKKLVAANEELGEQISETRARIAKQKERQQLLQRSTAASRETMEQLLEFQKLSIEKNVKPSDEEQKALAES